MKRGYCVYEDDAEYGQAVVATSSKNAKTMCLGTDLFSDSEYIDIKVSWKKKANVEKLNIGLVDDLMEGLKAGLYDWVEEEDCPICGRTDMIYNNNDYISCSECYDKLDVNVAKGEAEDKNVKNS